MHRHILGKPTGEPPMSHAETLHTVHPADGPTDAIVDFVGKLTYDALSDEVRHYARRHLLDTVGVMIAGAGGEIASRAEAVFGAAMATGKLRGLKAQQLAHALGIAASSAGGLFAFVNGGGDIKRLHAGHGSREGLQAALLAELGVEGPPGVIEARDGFMQAFAFGSTERARAVMLPPAVPFGITDCYIKPNPCCRHIQPAVEALIGLLNDEKIATDDVKQVEAETYRIAAEHAATGWDDFASSQLSFRYLMALALKFRAIKFDYFREDVRRDPALAALAGKVHVSAPPEIDRLYPQLRPARVTITTARGKFTRQADEALGSRLVPLDDAGRKAKFHA